MKRYLCEGLFNPILIEQLKDDYRHHRGIEIFKLWNLFVFEMWREKLWQH